MADLSSSLMRKNISRVFFGNAGSKLLGIGREVLSAALFGTGSAMGAFRVALAGTSVPMNFLTSDTLNNAFIPLYRSLAADSKESAQTFLWALLGLFAAGSLLIVLGLWLAADPWVAVLAPGLDRSTASLAVSMLRVMGISVPFYVISALLMFLAMANDDFTPMSLRASIQNVGLIAGSVTGFTFRDMTLLAWGFTLSYMVFAVWVGLRTMKAGLLWLPDRLDPVRLRAAMQMFWSTLRPLLLLPVLLQGNIVIERMVASLTGLVAVSALDYARFVTETVLLLIATPVAFAGLAHWSGMKPAAMREELSQIMTLTAVVAIPASSFLMANAGLLVETMYARGAFNEQSVTVTSDILFGTAVGLWAQVLGYVLVKALSAQLRSRAVLLVTGSSLLVNAAFNLLAYRHLGPLTLGLGNALYGIGLLVGAAMALSLLREILKGVGMLLLGAGGYLLAASYVPLPEPLWAKVAVTGAFAGCYWLSWVAAVPSLRALVGSFVFKR